MNDLDQAIDQLLSEKPGSLSELIQRLTPEIHEQLLRAIELGKFDGGMRLTPEQVQQCMQLVILYENKHLPEAERTGFDFPASCKSQQNTGAIPASGPPEGDGLVKYWGKH